MQLRLGQCAERKGAGTELHPGPGAAGRGWGKGRRALLMEPTSLLLVYCDAHCLGSAPNSERSAITLLGNLGAWACRVLEHMSQKELLRLSVHHYELQPYIPLCMHSAILIFHMS